MKVLVIGKGGREHALVRALRLSPSVSQVHITPGNVGMSYEAICHALPEYSLSSVLNLIKQHQIDLVVIGPEQELVDGWSDGLRKQGIPVFGPSQEAALLEGSKVFSKEFMSAAGVPTARSVVVSSVEQALAHAESFTPPYVLKADGLAAGKGVFICDTKEELRAAARQIFELRKLGAAGDRALLEQFSPGWELSYLILTNGREYVSLPLAQDHKRLLDQDKGPNTGGMGVVAPYKISTELQETIRNKVVLPTLKELERREFLYRGVLYFGLMITPDGPSTLEFNVRFGDPEAQVLLPLLNGDWGIVFREIAVGRLPEVSWKTLNSVCVVLAAEGYPDQPELDVPIAGSPQHQTASSYFLHAGTAKNSQGALVTAGGRVMNSIGLGSSLPEALAHAYEQAKNVSWQGLQMRRDIGHRLLQSQR